jgi:hypothetical protein
MGNMENDIPFIFIFNICANFHTKKKVEQNPLKENINM